MFYNLKTTICITHFINLNKAKKNKLSVEHFLILEHLVIQFNNIIKKGENTYENF